MLIYSRVLNFHSALFLHLLTPPSADLSATNNNVLLLSKASSVLVRGKRRLESSLSSKYAPGKVATKESLCTGVQCSLRWSGTSTFSVWKLGSLDTSSRGTDFELM